MDARVTLPLHSPGCLGAEEGCLRTTNVFRGKNFGLDFTCRLTWAYVSCLCFQTPLLDRRQSFVHTAGKICSR